MGLFSRRTDSGAADIPEPPLPPVASKSHGPWDIDEVDPSGDYVDFGAILLPVITGLEVSPIVLEPSQTIVGLRLLLETYEMQLMVFAAPRSGGLATDSLDQLCEQIRASGGIADQCNGRWGREAHCKVPLENDATNMSAMRVVCAEGPRWLLRAAIKGAAAKPTVKAFDALLDEVIVRRGDHPVPAGDALELSLPEITEES